MDLILHNDYGDVWITDIFNVDSMKTWSVNWEKVLKYTNSIDTDNSLLVNTNLHNVYGSNYQPFKINISGLIYRDILTSGSFYNMTQLIQAIKYIEQKIFLRRSFVNILVNGGEIKNCVAIDSNFSNVKKMRIYKGDECYEGYACKFSFTFVQVNTSGDETL